ncbi:MAG TPA: DUF1592 domain-containing protein [Bryobacteraceae bacterium]|nr:DUF1592 domain-containing protein [Bryobacteraceae bacterium]
MICALGMNGEGWRIFVWARYHRAIDVFRIFSFWLFLSAAHGAAGPFGKSLYPVFEEAGCRTCHHASGIAAATRLHFPETGASPERVEAFGRWLVTFVNREHPEQSLLLNKPTNRVKHIGAERIPAGGAEEVALKAWVDRLVLLEGEPLRRALAYKREEQPTKAKARSAMRRLTNSQYNNVVRDLVGELSQPAGQFPPEDYVNSFKNQFESQNLSPMLYEGYSNAAEKIARNAFRLGDSRGLIKCPPSPACRTQFVRSFGLQAFRRPLDADEQKRYESLFTQQTGFLKGAQAVVEAMLQSPHFLFRMDGTTDPKLTPYAAASRLSFALWDTAPDRALLESAARGELATRAGLERAARRLLADPQARLALDEFVSQWLQFDRVLSTTRDRRAYPKFSRETAVAMTEEAKRFVADLVWNDRNFMELFTAAHGYVNAELAAVYGVPAPAQEFHPVPFPKDSGRAGIFGQALFLTLTSKPGDTSPTSRGLFVREQFLCQHVPDPPPGVTTDLPALTEAKPQTNRERLAMHAANASCAGCHMLIDPIGHGLEKFDAIGERREKLTLKFYPEKVKNPKPTVVELELDTAGSVAGINHSNFQSPQELGEILARTPQCRECVVKQYFRYTAGRQETAADRAVIQRVYGAFEKSGFRFQEMIVSLMLEREFAP